MEPFVIKPKAHSETKDTKTKEAKAKETKETKEVDKKQTSTKKQTQPRRYLTAVTIVAGIITLIDENGQVCYYRQRGITNISPQAKLYLVNAGFLHRNWNQFKELPSNVTIRYEDEELLGKARATFPYKEASMILNIKE
jgi:hypothetical protein